ncbi:MAG: hypothetical protein ACYDAI_13465 [Trichloromonadaceae bacterium]
MKKISVLLLALTLTAGVTACSKPPAEEIAATKTAVDAVVAEGAEKYAPEEYKALQDEMTAAMEEVKAQEGKMFGGKYEAAKQQLAQVQASAATVKETAVAAREAMATEVVTVKEAAVAGLAELQALVAAAPVGKGSEADLEAIRADVAGLETSLQEVQPLIDAGDFAGAKEKADAIQAKVAEITAEIQAAQSMIPAPAAN